MPELWPAPFDEALRHIAGETRTAKLLRVRDHIAASLKRRGLASPANVKASFLARQRRPFVDEAEFKAFLAGYGSWWEAEKKRIAARTQANVAKPLDAGAATDG